MDFWNSESKEYWAGWKSPRNLSLSTGLGIATLDSGSSLLKRQSKFLVKGESQIRHSSSETQGSLAWEKKRSGWLGEYPRALHPTWQVEGEGRKLRPLLTTCGQLIRTKAALSPDGVTPPRPRGQGCQVTGIGVFSVPAASCPGKPDSQLGHLSGMDCRRAHRWGHPESNGPEQSPCQPLRSHQLPPLFAGVRFFAKWISSHIYRYNILWTLGFNNLICFFLHLPA